MATLTVYSDAADGYLRSNSGTWSIARAGTGGSLVDWTQIQMGASSTAYYTREAFVSFDTSSIPDAAVISAVMPRSLRRSEYAPAASNTSTTAV